MLAPTGPLPIEFSDGSVQFRQAVFARPGVTVASTGAGVAKAQRDAGAATAYWEMSLPSLVGHAQRARRSGEHGRGRGRRGAEGAGLDGLPESR